MRFYGLLITDRGILKILMLLKLITSMKESSVPKTRLRIFTLLLVAFLLCGSTTAVAASVSPSVQNSSAQIQIQALLKLLYQLQTQLIAMQSNANGSSIKGMHQSIHTKKLAAWLTVRLELIFPHPWKA